MTQHRMKKAFELFCAAVRAGATPAELVATVATTRRFAETGDVPAPPDLNSAIRRNAHLADEPTPRHSGEVPAPPSLNASVRAFMKRITR